MNKLHQILLGVVGIGPRRSMVWAALFALLALIIGFVRREDIDHGEGPLVVSGIGLVVGFVSGTFFGIIKS